MRRILFSLLLLPALCLHSVEIEIPERRLPTGSHIVSNYILDSKGERVIQSRAVYHSSGELEKEELFRETGQFLWTVHYRYSSAALLEERTALREKGALAWKVQYSYDRSNRITREIFYNMNDRPEQTIVYEYDSGITEKIAYGADGNMLWRRRTLDNTERRVRESSYYYPDGNLIKGVVQKYNSVGRIYEEIHIDEIGTSYRRIETEFDLLGRESRRTVFNHVGNIQRRVWFEYLPSGHVRRVRQILPPEEQEEETVYFYELDKRGAWVSRREVYTIHRPNQEEPLIQSRTEKRDIIYFSGEELPE